MGELIGIAHECVRHVVLQWDLADRAAAAPSSKRVKRVLLITDGACIGNPGPGGWACLLRFGAAKKEFSGTIRKPPTIAWS